MANEAEPFLYAKDVSKCLIYSSPSAFRTPRGNCVLSFPLDWMLHSYRFHHRYGPNIFLHEVLEK